MMERIKIFITGFVLHIFDFWILRRRFLIVPKTLLIVRLDGIGDYIIFRNFIEVISKSKKYKDYSITLCGNIIWKDIAEKFDSAFVDEFIWIDSRKMLSNLVYRKKTLFNIRKKGFEIAVQPTYSREVVGDAVIKASNAKERVGSFGDTTNINKIQKFIADKFYTKLIPVTKKVIFEFYRNKEFTESLLGEKNLLSKLQLGPVKIKKVISDYAVLMPGAGSEIRKWSPYNYAQVAKYLQEKYKLKIIIGGGTQDVKMAGDIIAKSGNIPIENVAGKVNLTGFVDLVSNAAILISNETSAVHIGVAVATPTVCISRGNRFGRFDPYPTELSKKIYYAYPAIIKDNITNKNHLREKYKDSSPLNVNKISAEDVCEIIDLILENQINE